MSKKIAKTRKNFIDIAPSGTYIRIAKQTGKDSEMVIAVFSEGWYEAEILGARAEPTLSKRGFNARIDMLVQGHRIYECYLYKHEIADNPQILRDTKVLGKLAKAVGVEIGSTRNLSRLAGKRAYVYLKPYAPGGPKHNRTLDWRACAGLGPPSPTPLAKPKLFGDVPGDACDAIDLLE